MFTLRIGMYTGKENKDTITSFINGYEVGRDGKCKFIKQMIKSIEEEYKIESQATGWIGQIEILSKKLETDWITIFKKQSLKILTKKFTKPIKKEFAISIKKRINGKMLGVKNHFRRDWIADWFGITDLKATWFRELWSKKELILMSKIEEEIKTYGNLQKVKTSIKPTDKLINLCVRMYEEMNKKDRKR